MPPPWRVALAPIEKPSSTVRSPRFSTFIRPGAACDPCAPPAAAPPAAEPGPACDPCAPAPPEGACWLAGAQAAATATTTMRPHIQGRAPPPIIPHLPDVLREQYHPSPTRSTGPGSCGTPLCVVPSVALASCPTRGGSVGWPRC